MKEKETKVVNFKKIFLCLGFLVLIQIMIPVIGNIKVIPSAYASDLITIENVTYTTAGGSSPIIAEITNANLEKVTIKDEIEINGKKYSINDYRIKINNTSNYDFNRLPKLKKLTIPAKFLKKQGLNGYIFKDANSIQELELTGKIELNKDEIADIKNLKNLRKVIIGEGITKIGNNFFSGMKSLDTVVVSTSLKEIGESAFANCSNMNYFGVYSPNNIEKICEKAFYNCSNLKGSIYASIFGNKLKYIGNSAFENCINFRDDFKQDAPISYLGTKAFMKTAIYSVNIGGTIKEVSAFAFAECPNLHFITLSKNITSIGVRAFYKCNANGNPDRLLNNPTVEIPRNVTNIQLEAFEGCNDINIKIPSSVRSIDSSALSNINGKITCASESYTEKYLKDKGISYNTYNDIVSLSDIQYKLTSSSSGYIAKLIKYNGTTTGTVKIHQNVDTSGIRYPVREICEGAFKSKKMSNVIIQENVRTIRKNAFANCANLIRVDIPKSVSYIEDGAFSGSKHVAIYANKTEYIQKYANRNNIKLFDITSNKVEVGTKFYYLDVLYEVKNNTTVKIVGYKGTTTGTLKINNPTYNGKTYIVDEIAGNAFKDSSFSVIDLRKATSIKTIKKYAFNNCKDLKEAYILSNVTNIDNYAFTNCNNLKTIYGEKNSSIEKYAKSKNIKFNVIKK